jgi:hypothetical protein
MEQMFGASPPCDSVYGMGGNNASRMLWSPCYLLPLEVLNSFHNNEEQQGA